MTTGPARFARLNRRAVIAVRGADRESFLQGLLTQTVEGLAGGETRYAALLTPQGRLLFEFFLVGRDDAILIDAPAPARDALIQRLGLYRLRAKVEIAPADEAVFVLWGAERAGEGWSRDPRAPSLGFRSVSPNLPLVEDGRESDEADYDVFRRGQGVVDTAVDALPENTYPIELNLDLLNGIDFAKGCFVGQETTSRMKRRGPVRSRLAPLRIEGGDADPGAEVLAGDLRAGQVVSSAGDKTLAILRLDRLGEGPLRIDGRPARLEPADWLSPVLAEV